MTRARTNTLTPIAPGKPETPLDRLLSVLSETAEGASVRRWAKRLLEGETAASDSAAGGQS
jgi:hypothetical protein